MSSSKSKSKSQRRREHQKRLRNFQEKIEIHKKEREELKRKRKQIEQLARMIELKNMPCESLLRELNIKNKKDFHKWARDGGHPDKGGSTILFQNVKYCIE